MSFLKLDKIRKSFGGNTGVREFDFAAERGEFISLLGPSGCGKTTVLRMIAGFERQDAGSISLDGKEISALPPNQRKIGMVFQAYALFPNMTVAQNIAFGLKVAKRPAAEIAGRVAEMLELIKLPQYAGRYPFQLSGGQQQRVALARALAIKPKMLLLDEPLSALDAKIRVSLREEIRAVQQELGITTLFVTHDQEEALSISDRIVVMSEGRIEQIGTPFEIYNRPRTRFVASFVGILNLLEGRITDPASGRVDVGGQELVVTSGFPEARAGDATTLALRPEAIRIGRGGDQANHLDGKIEDVGFQGAVVRIRVRCNDKLISLDSFNSPSAPPPERGTPVTISFPRDVQVLEPA
jgi:putative spermidine/putrescine transport system ATP-binding protein